MSEQGDQWEERDESRQDGTESNPGRPEDNEQGDRDEQRRQGDVQHEGDLATEQPGQPPTQQDNP